MFDMRLLALPSARGSPPREVLPLLDIYGIVEGYTAARSLLRPRLSPSARGFTLSSARNSIPSPDEPLSHG